MSYRFIEHDPASLQEDGTYGAFIAEGLSGSVTIPYTSITTKTAKGQDDPFLGGSTIYSVYTEDPAWDESKFTEGSSPQYEGSSDTVADDAAIEMLDACNVRYFQGPGTPTELPPVLPPQPAPPAEAESIYGKIGIQSQVFPTKDQGDISGGPAVRSKFNAWALYKYLNQPGVSNPKDVVANDYHRTITNDDLINPTANRIIQFASNTDSLSFNYSHYDFLATEHFGQISNDYLITLRRFAYPVPDDIINTKDFKTGTKEVIDLTQPDLARALTWLSPALGNDLKDVLKFAYKFKWKDEESQMQELQGGTAQNKRGALGSMIDGSNLFSAIESGVEGYSADAAARKKSRGDGYDAMGATYPNHVYGPLNVIKKVYVREQGLEFEQPFSLSFHYDLKGLPNTSPRVAFMDVMSNILALTYNNAPFWGGGARWVGGSGASSTGKPFGDYEKLKSGDYAGFASSIVTNLADKFSTAKSDVGGALEGAWGNAMNGDFAGALNSLGDSKILDNIIGGGLMKMLGGPGASGAQTAAAFLTGDPTGQWHLTIGNPMAPIMVIGNLALENSEISFEGPLGFEGFPTKMKLTVSLKPARPRDKGEIESMFNAGKGRFYLTPDIPGAKSLDDVIDISQYGNKDKKMNSGKVDRISDMSSG